MGLMVFGVLPAALAIFLKREREGLRATIWPCLAGFLFGVFLSVAVPSVFAGALVIDQSGPWISAGAMLILAFIINRKMIRPGRQMICAAEKARNQIKSIAYLWPAAGRVRDSQTANGYAGGLTGLLELVRSAGKADKPPLISEGVRRVSPCAAHL